MNTFSWHIQSSLEHRIFINKYLNKLDAPHILHFEVTLFYCVCKCIIVKLYKIKIVIIVKYVIWFKISKQWIINL